LPDDSFASLSASTALIVAAYVRNHLLEAADLPPLLSTVSSALAATVGPPPAVAQEPALSLRRLVRPDRVFCAECGTSLKSIKRHLSAHHDLTPVAYRAKWGLKWDHPMVAPNYAAVRSQLAKSIGFGRKSAAKPAKPRSKPAKAEAPAKGAVAARAKPKAGPKSK
jgi:predicted transcriptional regulator